MTYEKASIDNISVLVELRIKYLLEDYGNLPEDKLTIIDKNLHAYFKEHLNKDLFVFVCRDEDIIVSCCFLCISEKPSNQPLLTVKRGQY